MQASLLTRPLAHPGRTPCRNTAFQRRLVVTAGEGGRQADKAKYFEKQEEAEKKNPEPARLESEMRNSKPPTGAYGSTNRNKGADLQDKEHLEELDKKDGKKQ